MDRKWRLNRSALNTVQSIVEFETHHIGTWKDSCALATRTDVYALYSVLHIENKEWELKWSDACRGYYFVTRQEGTTTVPEGDEDVCVVHPEDEHDTKTTVLEKDTEVHARQLVVPVSSSLSSLTPRLLHALCSLGHGTARQVILALVDSNGVVSRCCLYDYIQAPLEASGVEAELKTL